MYLAQQTIENIRAALRTGDTGTAITALLTALDQNPTLAPAARQVRVLQADYERTRQQQRKGILDFKEASPAYNKVNDALLSIVDDLGTGTIPGLSAERRRRWMWPTVVAAALTLAFIAYRHFNKPICPEFGDKQGFRVMILPFQSLGDKKLKPESILLDRISSLLEKNKLPTIVKVLPGYDPDKNYPDADIATALGGDCNADLVLWGKYIADDSTRVSVQFKFTDSGKSGDSGFVSVKNLTDLGATGFTKTWNDVVFQVCTLIAMKNNNRQLALKWLEKIEEKGPEEMKMLEDLKKE